jgi:hypothetical protein
VKAAALIFFVLLVITHPAAAAAVLGVELVVLTVLGCVLIRALRPLCLPRRIR